MIFMQSDETCSVLFGVSDRSAIHILWCRKCAYLKGDFTTNLHGRGSSWPVRTRGLWSVFLALVYTAASFDIQTNINDVYLFFNAGVIERGGGHRVKLPLAFYSVFFY